MRQYDQMSLGRLALLTLTRLLATKRQFVTIRRPSRPLMRKVRLPTPRSARVTNCDSAATRSPRRRNVD